MNRYAIKLKFKIDDIVNEEWRNNLSNFFFVKKYDCRLEWEKILKPDFLDLLETMHPIGTIFVFNKSKTWSNQDAHTDPVLYGLNIIPTNSGAYMQWFESIDTLPRPVIYTITGTPYTSYNSSDIILVHQEQLDYSASIVNTSLLHRIKIGFSARTCISIRFKHNFKTWEEVYNFYKSQGWILE